MKTILPLSVLGLGLLLLVLSGVWVSLFSGKGSFPTEKAERWSQVKERMNNLAFIVYTPPGAAATPRGANVDKAKAELEQLRVENEQLTREFSGAYDTPRTTATILKWSGISLAAIGIIGWYAVSQSR